MYLSETKSDFEGKSILVRIDSDVDLSKKQGRLVVDEEFRLKSVLPTLHFLKEKGAGKIILLGHLGRPGGKAVASLSLKPVADWFSENLSPCRLVSLGERLPVGDFFILENLRFNPGEKANDKKFAEELASLGDFFVNDAFGVSHREHASIVGLSELLPSFLGIRFEGEIKAL